MQNLSWRFKFSGMVCQAYHVTSDSYSSLKYSVQAMGKQVTHTHTHTILIIYKFNESNNEIYKNMKNHKIKHGHTVLQPNKCKPTSNTQTKQNSWLVSWEESWAKTHKQSTYSQHHIRDSDLEFLDKWELIYTYIQKFPNCIGHLQGSECHAWNGIRHSG
jgi:hypothetical protein